MLTLYKYNELYQWDTGRALLIIPDSAGNVPTQVEFEYNDVVIPMTPETDGDNQIVSIPDVCLQQSGLLIAYEVINIDGHTTYNRNMYTIKSKNKPDGYVYEESEILNWHELDARISKLEESSGSSADAVAIDKTLTQSGQAADAAAVGDAISSLSEEKVNLPKNDDGSIIAGTNGQYATSDGAGGFNWTDGQTALPNPNALTFTGAVTGSYDGSEKMSARIPQVVSWANKELFDKADLVDPGNNNSFITVDDVEYYRYNAGPNSFYWENPYPLTGSLTITYRILNQYNNGVDTSFYVEYSDGTDTRYMLTYDTISTFTTDASKTVVKVRGNYDAENWMLLDMSVMSIVANYDVGVPLADSNVPGGIIADPATSTDTVPAKIGEDGKLYVPDMSGGSGGTASGDYIPVPSTAEVGQTIVVKAVDENGKPTEWEAADMASGGSNEKLLVEYIHNANSIYQPTDFDKNTGIFTCVGHGLTTSTPVVNWMNDNNPYDLSKVPFYNNADLFLVPVDEDHFTLKNWDYANDENLDTVDISSFHFETSAVFTISGIPYRKRVRIVMIGKTRSKSWFDFGCSLLGTNICMIANNVVDSNGQYYTWGRTGYNYGNADGIFYLESVITVCEAETVAKRHIYRCDSKKGNSLLQDFVGRYMSIEEPTDFNVRLTYSGNNCQGVANGFIVRVYDLS